MHLILTRNPGYNSFIHTTLIVLTIKLIASFVAKYGIGEFRRPLLVLQLLLLLLLLPLRLLVFAVMENCS
jgi:hypothetical protein